MKILFSRCGEKKDCNGKREIAPKKESNHHQAR
jgi:hypothetical protein